MKHNNTESSLQSLHPEVDAYFKGVYMSNFEEKIFRQWLISNYGEKTEKHLFYVDDFLRKQLHATFEAYFQQLSYACVQVSSSEQDGKSNVIAIAKKSDIVNDEFLGFRPTFYFEEMGGEFKEVEEPKYAKTFHPDHHIGEQVLDYLIRTFPDYHFELVPYLEAYWGCRNLS